jgi:hypothetical protein
MKNQRTYDLMLYFETLRERKDFIKTNSVTIVSDDDRQRHICGYKQLRR